MAVTHTISFAAVAAIDFGTARSGYGYALSADPKDIICPTDWVGGQGLDLKTLTNILLDKNTKTYTHFGYEAREEYQEQCEDGDANLFFEKFKMSLYSEDGIQDTLTSACGKSVASHIVFREALAYMKDQVLEKINKRAANSKLLTQDILWVITVPGMWADKAKSVMRTAAEEAGMGTHNNLMLALEPEAASFYCKSESKEADLPVGGKYVVVDCGGGTVDIACHEVSEDGIIETHPATGGPWGSTYIDEAFVSLLGDIFTTEKISNFQNRNPGTWVEFLSSWESTKLRVKDFKRDKRVPLPLSLYRYFGEESGITQKCKRYTQSNKAKLLNQTITFSDGLKLGSNTLQSLFMPVLEKISHKIKELLKDEHVKYSTHICVVGGFAESRVLQTHLKGGLKGWACITPVRTGLAVIKGAVHYGFEPRVITARMSRYTYGFSHVITFDENIHPAEKRVSCEGRDYCDDIFHTFVSKGQIVGIDESFNTIRIPAGSAQKSALVKIYTSKHSTDPTFTTEKGCTRIGNITLKNLPEGPRVDKEIDVCMQFGGTSIFVTATLMKCGTKCETTLDYM